MSQTLQLVHGLEQALCWNPKWCAIDELWLGRCSAQTVSEWSAELEHQSRDPLLRLLRLELEFSISATVHDPGRLVDADPLIGWNHLLRLGMIDHSLDRICIRADGTEIEFPIGDRQSRHKMDRDLNGLFQRIEPMFPKVKKSYSWKHIILKTHRILWYNGQL